jgi:hypothetical protein
MIFSMSSGMKNMVLPISRNAPILLALSLNVRSEICMPADCSLATAADGDIALSRMVAVIPSSFERVARKILFRVSVLALGRSDKVRLYYAFCNASCPVSMGCDRQA